MIRVPPISHKGRKRLHSVAQRPMGAPCLGCGHPLHAENCCPGRDRWDNTCECDLCVPRYRSAPKPAKPVRICWNPLCGHAARLHQDGECYHRNEAKQYDCTCTSLMSATDPALEFERYPVS
jgi:hypothetical protein